MINRASPADDSDYVVDLANCRLMLPEEGVRELAGAADALTVVVKEALIALEADWGASDFPFVQRGGMKVALAAIRTDVWREMMRFAHEHDVAAGKGPWHMFDAAPNVLKPFTEREDERFNCGYHGVFHVTEEIDGLSREGEVVLLWQPNETGPNKQISSSDWWSCEFAFKWLSEELLPEINRWVFNRHFSSSLKRTLRRNLATQFAGALNEAFVARDLRQRPLFRNGLWCRNVVGTIQELQHFFSVQRTPEPYVQQKDAELLYRAAAMLARGERGYAGYVSSKLSLDDGAANHAQLVAAIERKIESGRVVASAGNVDFVLRAILELLNDSDEWVTPSDREIVLQALTPFTQIFDEANFIKRHREWV